MVLHSQKSIPWILVWNILVVLLGAAGTYQAAEKAGLGGTLLAHRGHIEVDAAATESTSPLAPLLRGVAFKKDSA
ncbi:MAG: hypothetical protein DYG96_15790, partial [Chlorobi bacterium CHB2]|nr:hypothetical protein [Chlorobi bacterium CHB2]